MTPHRQATDQQASDQQAQQLMRWERLRVSCAPEAPEVEAFDLGEGPAWDLQRGTLSQVDITAGRLHEFDLSTGERRVLRVGQHLGAAVPRQGGGYVLAMRDGIAVVEADQLRPWDPEGTDHIDQVQWIATDIIPSTHRFNDAKCDPQGRLWAGSIALDHGPTPGALYRIEADGSWDVALDQVAFCNGMGWTDSGSTFYFIDSKAPAMLAFDVDAATGTLSGRREHIRFDPNRGTPDGMAVDIEDHVWVALYGGHALQRYRPDGTLEREVPFPAANPTCPGFGGSDLMDLYVTSAFQYLEERSDDDGRTCVTRAPAPGVPAHRFAG